MPALHGCAGSMRNNPICLPIGNWYNHDYLSQRIYKHEESCEVSVLSTVAWEGRGEIPLTDPISGYSENN